MSLSARERRNPPPRRKSCAACIKAKRRCDTALPTCARCEQRNQPCDYGKVTASSNSAATPIRNTISKSISLDPAIGYIPLPVSNSPPTFDWDQELAMGIHELPLQLHDIPLDPTILFTPPPTNIASLDPESTDLPLSYNWGNDDDPSQELIARGPSTLMPTPSSKQLEFTSDVIWKRLNYAVEVIVGAPKSMVFEMQTPWCHPLLYEPNMPRCIEDAISSCALYLAKNSINSPILLRSITTRVQELAVEPIANTVLNRLARVHSLILYEIMLLFDGDIASRRLGERLIPTLESAAMQLTSLVNFESDLQALQDLPLYPINPVRAIWHDWILQESARRTVMFTFYFVQAYRLLAGYQGMQCDSRLRLANSWTMSSRLWEAGSAAEFAEAWREGRFFTVTRLRFTEVLQIAKAEDVDSFGRIWISSLLGVDETEGWFASRGSKLRMEAVR